MKAPTVSKKDKAHIDELVELFKAHASTFEVILSNLRTEVFSKPDIAPHVHSLRLRVKDPEHLREKLRRKLLEAKRQGTRFSVSTRNLFAKINDLAGMRVLHLHTEQFQSINLGLQRLFRDHSYQLVEGPIARTWDMESKQYFERLLIRTVESPSLYTSVHYVIRANTSESYTCEIQVRTLMEEVWGEVDHKINYPDKSESLACREQLLALARSTSACSRLVDSIFRSHSEHDRLTQQQVGRRAHLSS